jgi:hypothetical protein
VPMLTRDMFEVQMLVYQPSTQFFWFGSTPCYFYFKSLEHSRCEVMLWMFFFGEEVNSEYMELLCYAIKLRVGYPGA